MYKPQEGHCFHCNEPCPDGEEFAAPVFGNKEAFCCQGCQSVCEGIIANGLEDYYRYRTAPAPKTNLVPEELNQIHKIYDSPELEQDYLTANDGELKEVQLSVTGISCSACAWLIETQIKKLSGVLQVGVDVSAQRTSIRWNKDKLTLSEILNQFDQIGYEARPYSPDSQEQEYEKQQKTYLKKLGVAGLMTMQVMMLAIGLYFGVFGNIEPETKQFFHWISLLLTTPVVFYSGSIFISNALNALSVRKLNMDVPIAIAVLLTFASSTLATIKNDGDIYFESVAMFVFLLLIGRYLEYKSRQKAYTNVNNASKHFPVLARAIYHDNNIKEIPAKSVVQDQLLLVKPGDTVPTDSVVVEGHSSVDESLLTGESAPISKQPGSKLFGGSINGKSVLTVKALGALQDSAVHKITRMKDLALSEKPKFAIYIDQIAQKFVLTVLILAAASYLFWSVYEPSRALWVAVSVLVATCPCALGLATPTAYIASMSKLSKLGILLKRSDSLEELNTIDVVALDKTGTLTEIEGQLSSWENKSEYDDHFVKQVAKSLEAISEHPIAAAFNFDVPTLPLEQTEVITAKGIKGDYRDLQFKIGTYEFCGVEKSYSKANDSPIYLSVTTPEQGSKTVAIFFVQERLKKGAKALSLSLNKQALLLLSGDREQKVATVANELRIENYHAQLSPEAKLQAIRGQQKAGKKVMMLGDGINDSPVLAGADISLAVSSATDFAQSAADILLLNDDLSKVKELFLIAEKTKKVIKQNIYWANGYNLLILPWALSGNLTPWMAVIGMSASSLIVTFNSLRLSKINKD